MAEKFNDLINGNTPVLVDFSAEWCAPCRMMPPILKQLKSHFGDRLRIITVDVDRNPFVAQKYVIRGVPTLILFRNGQILWRQAGVIPANQLIPILSRFIT